MIIVSNGFNKFHLATAASAVAARKKLTALLTGAYPFSSVQRLLLRAGINHRRILKFFDRREQIEAEMVKTSWLSEALYFLQYPLRRKVRRLADWIDRTSFRLYGLESSLHLFGDCRSAEVFHYRAGFGHSAARRAREIGMILVCDHSLVHPGLIDFLVASRGELPVGPMNLRPSLYWSGPLEDIDFADYILVNSDFVKNTFLFLGYKEAKIKVIYWGLDRVFERLIPERIIPAGAHNSPIKLVYAGTWEARKGVQDLVEALSQVKRPWTLQVLGAISHDEAESLKSLSLDARIVLHGSVRRIDLARVFSTSDVLVFPTYAEGSARVIFEAMACGCAIITTPNAGSIVRHLENGWLIPPGNIAELTAAIEEAADQRNLVMKYGERNHRTVKSNFTEDDYGEQLVKFYEEITKNNSRGMANVI